MKILSVLAVTLYCVVGEKIKIGELKNLHHGVSGTVYAADDTTILIEDFNYDGAGWDNLHQSHGASNNCLQVRMLFSGLELRGVPVM